MTDKLRQRILEVGPELYRLREQRHNGRDYCNRVPETDHPPWFDLSEYEKKEWLDTAGDAINMGLPLDSKPLHAVGVSVLLSMSDGCILLGKRKANTAAGLLSTPGGRLELGEDPFACARREFKEECGAELYGDIKLLAVRSHNRFGSGPYLMFYMHATGYTGIIENKEPDKCERWSWHDVRALDYTQCTEPKDIVRLIEWPAAKRHGD